MHDPLVVAFEICRPWPRRSRFGNSRWYWPAIITVWHREPRGHDSGEVCKHYRRYLNDDGWWQTKVLYGWKFHVHHWKVQVHPAQALRRWALTRCAWCGGRSRKGDYVNTSHQWDGPRGRWWRGEPGLYHGDCSSVSSAHRLCFCADPGLSFGTYGRCAFCGKWRSHREMPDEADALLASLPKGARVTPDIRAAVEPLWAERRRRREAKWEAP